MKALVLRENKFEVEDVKTPDLQAGQALVKIHYAALNHRDQWIRIGQYAKIQLPAILGSDGCGTVVSVHDETDSTWVGKQVVINPNINWGPDPRHQQRDYQILGMPSQGTLAEYIAVNTDRLYEKPAYLSDEQAAAFPLAAMTAYNALFNKGHAEKNQQVLISGVGGGVAQFAFLFSVAIGAEVYVTSSKAAVIDKCMQLGAKGGCDYRNAADLKNMGKAIGGFDIIIDSACGDGMNDLIALLKPAGKFVFYGATKGLPKELNMRPIFWNHLQILGSTMGSDTDFFRMLDLCKEHRVQPILDKTFTLENGVAAFDRMAGGEQFGKIIIKIAS
jgi:NADPH:quinone reductase-like Zn-dependent oxidoreductase